MKISFHGAAREVTGSCHLIDSDRGKVLLDCGLIQGGKERHERNREPFPFDASELDCVVLSHAHIDHSGRLPLLCKAGFRGPIFATTPTVALCRILLADSAHIHEEDARWKIKRLRKRGEPYDWVKPLYTSADVEAALQQFVPVDFEQLHEMGDIGSVRFVKAGHILGAAIVELALSNGDDGPRRITFSGDLGVDGSRLLNSPGPVERPDCLLIESTYGDRSREESADRTDELYEIIDRTIGRGGKVVIPAFAVGRTQEVLARINDMVESGRLSGVPVYVDSPMARAATQVFALHPEAYSDNARRLLRAGDEPLEFPGLHLTRSVEESIEINKSKQPSVIISASGMCTAGRIKHHLKHNIADSRNTVMFVGYQARGTLGSVIRSGVTPVRIFGDLYPVRASIETIVGFSAHADKDELLAWFEGLGGNPERTFAVHGEEDAAEHFARSLRDRFGATVDVPHRGESFDLD